MLKFWKKDKETSSENKVLSPGQIAINNFRENKLAMIGFYAFVILIVGIYALSFIIKYDPLLIDTPNKNLPPFTTVETVFDAGLSTEYVGERFLILGSDHLGRDVFHRLIHGGRFSLEVSFVGTFIATILGLVIGSISGFYGGVVDNILMRFGEIVRSFPFLPLAITLSFIMKNKYPDMDEVAKIFMIMAVLGLIGWTGLARMVRGQILSIREQEYILAAKALGISDRHQIARHIFPNIVNIIIVSATLGFAGYILTESGLSFLGFGADPATQPSWGNMLQGGTKSVVVRDRPWLWVPAGTMLFMTVLSINLIGDGLRDAIDPKSNDR